MTDKADYSLRESISALVDGEAEELELRRILRFCESDSEDGARQVWRRYQLAGAVMRGDFSVDSGVDLATKVASAIAAGDSGIDDCFVEGSIPAEGSGFAEGSIPAEGSGFAEGSSFAEGSIPAEGSTHSASGRISSGQAAASAGFGGRAHSAWFEGLGKFAIAASVALAMVAGFHQYSLYLNGSDSLDSEFVARGTAAGSLGESSAVVPEGYRIPALNAMTVSSVPGRQVRQTPSLKSLVLPARQNARVVSQAELQEQLQRMLMLHAEKASAEVGITVVPFSRMSRQDSPEE